MQQNANQVFAIEHFRPFLFIDTGQSVSSEELTHHYLQFENDFASLKLCEQLTLIFQRIQDHMQKTKGYIAGAGYVRRYFFVFDKAVALEITPAGQIIATHNDFDASDVKNPNIVLTKIILPETKFIGEMLSNE